MILQAYYIYCILYTYLACLRGVQISVDETGQSELRRKVCGESDALKKGFSCCFLTRTAQNDLEKVTLGHMATLFTSESDPKQTYDDETRDAWACSALSPALIPLLLSLLCPR